VLQRRIGDVTYHGCMCVVYILTTHDLVMRGGVMVGEVICIIIASCFPIYSVLTFFNSVFYPIKLHVHCFLPFPIDFVV
jgi:hypothetical protein